MLSDAGKLADQRHYGKSLPTDKHTKRKTKFAARRKEVRHFSCIAVSLGYRFRLPRIHATEPRVWLVTDAIGNL